MYLQNIWLEFANQLQKCPRIIAPPPPPPPPIVHSWAKPTSVCLIKDLNITESFIMFPIRYTACSYRGVEERLPHGSTLRLNDPLQHCGINRLDSHSRHGSLQRLESQSRHSSVRDLTITAQAIQSSPGNGIHRVIEGDAAKA